MTDASTGFLRAKGLEIAEVYRDPPQQPNKRSVLSGATSKTYLNRK